MFDKGRPGREQSGVALADGMQFLASALLASRRSRYATGMAPVVVSPVKRVSSAAGRQVSALLIFRLMGSFRIRYVARGVPYTIATSLAHSPSSKFQPRHSLTRQMAIHSLSLRAGCGLGRRTGNRRLGKIIIERLSIVNEPRSSLAPRHLFQRSVSGFR